MSLYLTKILALPTLPLGWVLLLGLVGLSLLVVGRARAGRWVLVAQLALLWTLSMPWTAERLGEWWESGYPPVALEQTPVADVAIVLGGGLRPVGRPPGENLNDASDRMLRAARLFRDGKVRNILVTGGNLPWLAGSVPEALLVRDLLVEWGVPREAIFLETASTNTRENAVFSSDVVRTHRWERILLVTSAAHMARAVGAFRAVGLEVIPSPTDYRVVERAPLDLLDFLPDSGAFDATTAVVREVVGVMSYRWRGWLM